MMKKTSLSNKLRDLSREEKEKLYTLLEERKRRARMRRERYTPNSGQVLFHNSQAKIRLVTAGNGSGKTTGAVQEAFWAALGYNPILDTYTKVPSKVIVVLDKPEKVSDVWLEEIKEWYNIEEDQLRKNGKPYVNEITFKNGSSIQFMFHEQSTMSYESVEVDFVVFDEPPPRHIFVALFRGGRKKGTVSKYLIIGTPIAGSWMRTELYEPWAKGERDDIECFRYGTEVNEENLAEGYIDSFSRILTEKERRIRLEGQFFDLDGLALAHLFKKDTHLVASTEMAWDSTWPVVIGIDPHPSKAHVAVMLGCMPDGNYILLKELTSKAPPRAFAEELKTWYKNYRVVDIICDSLGSGKTTGGDGNLSFIEVLNDVGVRARATTFEDKKEESWIMRIQEVLSLPLVADNFGRIIPKLRIMRNCTGTIHDIETVTWMQYRNEDLYKPSLDIRNKDFLAALKYALASNLYFHKGRARAVRTKAKAESYGVKQRPRSGGYNVRAKRRQKVY